MTHPPDPRYAGSLGPAPTPAGTSSFGSPGPAAPLFGAPPFGAPQGTPGGFGTLPPASQRPQTRRNGKSKLGIGLGLVLAAFALLRVGALILNASNAARDVAMPATAAGRPDTSASQANLVSEVEQEMAGDGAQHPTVVLYGNEPIVVVAFRNRIDVDGEWSDAGMQSSPNHKHGDISCRSDKSGVTACLDSGFTLSVEALSLDPHVGEDVLVQAIKDVQAAN